VLLAIDVGNTNIVVGVFDAARLLVSWRLLTLRERTADEVGLIVIGLFGHERIETAKIDSVVIGSVVPPLTPIMRSMIKRYFNREPLVVDPKSNAGMPILYERPAEVGADRIANAVGAYDLYGGPTIVVDFGTATTIEAVSEKGEYLGGAIFPGIEISMDALFARAARLNRVELQPPKHVIGKSTAESVQSGAMYGFSAQVDGLVDRFVAELGDCTVVSTGGLADLISPHARTVQHYEPWLTLYGLRIIFERNT